MTILPVRSADQTHRLKLHVKMSLFTGIFALVIVGTSCASVLATRPFVRGTIVSVGDGWIDVRHKSGRVVRVVTTGTRTPQGLGPNVKALIELQESDDTRLVAREIQIFGKRDR